MKRFLESTGEKRSTSAIARDLEVGRTKAYWISCVAKNQTELHSVLNSKVSVREAFHRIQKAKTKPDRGKKSREFLESIISGFTSPEEKTVLRMMSLFLDCALDEDIIDWDLGNEFSTMLMTFDEDGKPLASAVSTKQDPEGGVSENGKLDGGRGGLAGSRLN